MTNTNAFPVETITDIFESLLDGKITNVFKDEPAQAKPVLQPPVNIYETEHGFEIDVLAPGVLKEDIKLSVVDSTLTLAYEKTAETADAKRTLKNEFSIQGFKRSFTLGEKIDTENINASFENGILKVVLPKKEAAKATQIEIAIK